MASTAQIQAALANAQHSTGPRSAEGKAASSKNALKLGLYSQALILPGEDPEELAALSRGYSERFRPQDPIEEILVEELVRAEWLKRRYRRIETQVFNERIAALPEGSDPESAVAQVFMQDAEGPRILQKVFRRQEAAERQFRYALTGLCKAVAERRRAAQAPPDSLLRLTRSRLFQNEPDLTPTRAGSTPAAPPPANSPARATTPRPASDPAGTLRLPQLRRP